MFTDKVWVVLGTLVVVSFAAPGVSNGAVGGNELLSAEQAFIIGGKRIDAGKVEITVNVAEGYAVYKERMTVTREGSDGEVLSVAFPKPQAAMSVPGGTVLHKYKGTNAFLVSTSKQAGALVLVVEVQGCAEVGVCYQPMQKRMVFQ